MSGLFQKILGGAAPSPSPAPASEDADFADFAGAPDPSPISIIGDAATGTGLKSSSPTGSFGSPVPYTKWYRVWERTSVQDFYAELFIFPFLLTLVLVHLWGTRKNRRKANAWATAYAPVLQEEYALVGFGGRRLPTADEVGSSGLAKASESEDLITPEEILKEKGFNEYISYASGRQNVAFLDVKLSLIKRYNPVGRGIENVLGFLFESMPAPDERMEATAYVFDGRESELVTVPKGSAEETTKHKGNSTYDGFVWAVVHKDCMKRLRDGRYDLSLTTTKDHPKLPNWATIMTESAEITDALLTPELVKAIDEAGEALEALIVSDQPIDQPKKLNEAIPKKRVSLSVHLPTDSSSTASASHPPTLPLFRAFLRLPDHLVSTAHFRPEVMRRIRAKRDDEIRKIKKGDEANEAEERREKMEKEKKAKRESLLNSMSADEQRKFLEKERAVEMRRGQKKMTTRA